jgi:hypothetical protein
MFQQFIATIKGSYYLRSKSSSIYGLDVHELLLIQSYQLTRDATWSHP